MFSISCPRREEQQTESRQINSQKTSKMISIIGELNFKADYEFQALLFSRLGVNNSLTTGN